MQLVEIKDIIDKARPEETYLIILSSGEQLHGNVISSGKLAFEFATGKIRSQYRYANVYSIQRV